MLVLVVVALVYRRTLLVGIVGIKSVVRVFALDEAVFIIQVDHLIGVVQAVVRSAGGLPRLLLLLLLLLLLRCADGGCFKLLNRVGGQVVEVMVGNVKAAVGHCCIAFAFSASVSQLRSHHASPRRWRCRAARRVARCALRPFCRCGAGATSHARRAVGSAVCCFGRYDVSSAFGPQCFCRPQASRQEHHRAASAPPSPTDEPLLRPPSPCRCARLSPAPILPAFPPCSRRIHHGASSQGRQVRT